MLDFDRPLLDNEYEDDEGPSVRFMEMDTISEAVGSPAYLTDHILDECRQVLQDGTNRRLFPERFERFYFEPRRLLIDVVDDATPSLLVEARAAKRCAFKEEWCAQNGWAYVAIPESIVFGEQPVVAIRAHIKAVLEPTPPVAGVAGSGAGDGDDPGSREPVRKRGAVSRPKATA